MSAIPQKYKVVFLGDEAAGKTSLVRRYMYDTFELSIQATIGMDFQSKTVYLEDRTIRLQLWDTAGQERFRSLIPSYIRDAAAAVVVYDVTKRGSFVGIRKWIEDVRAERGEAAVVALLGNKCDLGDSREVSTDEGRQQAEELGAIVFHETSAKDGTNVAPLFQQLADRLPTSAPTTGAAAGSTSASTPAGAGAGIKLQAPTANRKRKDKCKC